MKASEHRELTPFSSLTIKGKAIEAYVALGSPAAITVTADDNLIPFVTSQVAGEQLTVGLSRAVSSRLGLRVDITAPAVTSVIAGQAVKVHLSDLNADRLSLQGDTGSSTTASGNATHMSLKLVGGARAELSALQAQDAVVSLDGAATAEVMATRSVTGEARGVSHLGVWGSPAVDVKTAPASTVTMMGTR